MHACPYLEMVKKAPANPGAESAAQGDPVAPWNRGNNCPPNKKIREKEMVTDVAIPEIMPPGEVTGALDVSKLPAKERRAILRRITEEIYNKKKAQSHVESRNYSPLEVLLSDFASSIGIELSESQVNHLLNGKRIRYGDRIYYATHDGALRSFDLDNSDVQLRKLWKTLEKHIKVDHSKIIREPLGHYLHQLKRIDLRTWQLLSGKIKGGEHV